MGDVKNLRDALTLIEEASKNDSAELRNMLANDYTGVKKAVFMATPESAWKSIKSAKDAAMDYTVDKAKMVDRSVHDHPWYYIGGAALISAIIGYLLGRSSK